MARAADYGGVFVKTSEFSPPKPRKRPSPTGRRHSDWGITVSVTGFSVAQTGFSVAQTVAPAGDFRPAAVLFGVSLQRRGCSRFWPQNSRFAHSVQWRMVFLRRGAKQRRQRSLPYNVVEAGPDVVHFSDDNLYSDDNIRCPMRCRGHRGRAQGDSILRNGDKGLGEENTLT